jgi:hypothetical protein
VALIEGPESGRCSRLRLQDARSELQTAYDVLADMGAAGFAGRARIGLPPPGRGSVRAATDLAPQEKQVATLVPAGPPIARRPPSFLSARRSIITYATCTRSWCLSRTQMVRKITAGTG